MTSYTDPTSDSIFLEDESGRLCLCGPILASEQFRGAFVTGVVAAFLGTELENGHFHVQDVCWPGLPDPPREIAAPPASSKKPRFEPENKGDDLSRIQDRPDDEYLVLLSGLDLGSPHSGMAFEGSGTADLGFAQTEMRLSLLAEWIGGEIGSASDRQRASHVAGVIVAGNLMTVQNVDGSFLNASDSSLLMTGAGAAGASKASSSSSKSNMSNAAKLSKFATAQANANLSPSPHSVLLSHLLPLSASLPLVLMPGPTDPASAAMPQQGIHKVILKGVEKWSGSLDDVSNIKDEKGEKDARTVPASAGGIHLYNNPTWLQFGCEDDDESTIPYVKVLATSGQNLDDIMKYVPVGVDVGQDDGINGAEISGMLESNRTPAGDTDAGANSQGTLWEDERLSAAFRLLSYGHVAPTCPDTLWCFPFTDRDPFIIDEAPDVFVIGNQPRFATGLWSPSTDGTDDGAGLGITGQTASQAPLSQDTISSASLKRHVRVVLLPRFSQTGQVVLLNTRTKEVEKVTIGWQL